MFCDVSFLDCAEVVRIATAATCDDEDYLVVEAPILKSLNYYSTWKKKMIAYLDSKLTKENLRLSYVVRGNIPSHAFLNFKHKLQWVIPIDGLSAAYLRDYKIVFFNYGLMHH